MLDIDNQYYMHYFMDILHPLKNFNWQVISSNDYQIRLNQKYNELKEIDISFQNPFFHINVPLPNSKYSYYKRFYSLEESLQFLNQYIQYI
jgi:hypothetical protein